MGVLTLFQTLSCPHLFICWLRSERQPPLPTSFRNSLYCSVNGRPPASLERRFLILGKKIFKKVQIVVVEEPQQRRHPCTAAQPLELLAVNVKVGDKSKEAVQLLRIALVPH